MCPLPSQPGVGHLETRQRSELKLETDVRFGQGGTSGLAGCLFSTNLHQKLFLAVFGLKLDLEAAGRDLARVLPVLQVVLVLFLSI